VIIFLHRLCPEKIWVGGQEGLAIAVPPAVLRNEGVIASSKWRAARADGFTLSVVKPVLGSLGVGAALGVASKVLEGVIESIVH